MNAAPSLPNHSQRKRRSHESLIARTIRFRRNALLGVIFGLFGIFLGVVMALFPVQFSEDPTTGVLIIVVIFCCGYAGVMAGCWWWVKAKAWSEGVAFIGALPLVILFIPGVRLLYAAVPLLLPLGMIMMPLILIVVVSVLPDKSGISKSKRTAWSLGAPASGEVEKQRSGRR